MYIYELKYRITNGSCCFNKRVLVLAEQLEPAKDRARTALSQRYGDCVELSLVTYKCHDNIWVEPD